MDYELKYKWKSKFNDGSVIEQFDLMGQEINFRKVVERLGEVNQFEVSGGGHTIIVDLKSGFFYVNGIKLVPSYNGDEILSEDISKRLIFFRSVYRHFGESLESSGIDVVYCVGWQCSIDGRNIKHILRIAPDETIIFESNK